MTDNDKAWSCRAYLDSLDAEIREWCLPWVQVCLFVDPLPPGLGSFSGHLAALGIDRLGLSPSHTLELLEAIAKTGARVPGSELVLHVVRPWNASFRSGASTEIELPVNWLEGVEVWDRRKSERIWMGKKVVQFPRCPAPPQDAERLQAQARQEFVDFDWSAFIELPFGWQRRATPLSAEMTRRTT